MPRIIFNITELEEKLAAITLAAGAHGSFSQGVCALEAAAYLAGEDQTDHPQCVCPYIASFVRSWNDQLQTNAERDRWIKPLIIKMLDSRSDDPVVLRKRAYVAADWAIHEAAVLAFGFASEALTKAGLTEHATKLTEQAAILKALPEVVDKQTADAAADAADAAADAAYAAAYAAADAARAARAAYAAADAAAYAAAYAADAAADAADAADARADLVNQARVNFVERMLAVKSEEVAA